MKILNTLLFESYETNYTRLRRATLRNELKQIDPQGEVTFLAPPI